MVDMIQKSWQLTKILYKSGPHFRMGSLKIFYKGFLYKEYDI